MRRFLPAAVVAALVLGLLAQSSAPSPDKTKEHPEAQCVVAGRVVTAAEGTPLKSARVGLVPERLGWETFSQSYATTSESDGRFLLKDVAPGRYQFFANREGFVEQQYESESTDDGAVLGLTPGQKISEVLFRMTAAAVITGRVNNEDGEPMTGVQVAALRRPTEEEKEEEDPSPRHKREFRSVATSPTDDRGQYRIFGLKPGEYYIRATDSGESGNASQLGQMVRETLGSEYAPLYYPGLVQVGQAQVVSVKPGDEVQTDFSMQRIKTVEIAGRVIGPGGKRAWVNLAPSGEDDFGSRYNNVTDENGNFRLKGIPPGSYVIVVYQLEEGNNYEAHTRQKVEVGGENIESLNISLSSSTNFQGRVTVAGPGSVTLDQIGVAFIPIDEDGPPSREAHVKKDGSFEITLVRDGNYAIRAWGLDHEWYVKSARLGPDDILEKGLQVEKGTSGARLEVVVSSASAQVEGSVIDGDQAVTGAHVRLKADPETPYNRFRAANARTDQTGHFSVAGLAPGNYRVMARFRPSPGSDSLKSDPQVVTLSEHDRKTVQLTVTKPQAE